MNFQHSFGILGIGTVLITPSTYGLQEGAALAVKTISAQAQTLNAAGTAGDHIFIEPKDFRWKEAPSLPAGTMVAVIDGDPSKAGPFTMRLRFPDGTKIPPHYHPADEHVTVITGRFSMALGEKWDDKALHEMEPGSYMMMKEGVRHFALSRGITEVQLHGVGPWGIVYVNPGDDPMKKTSKAK